MPAEFGTHQDSDDAAQQHEVLDLIGAIYDAVIDPARWHDALHAICVRYRFCLAMLDLVDMSRLDDVLSVHVNIAPPFQNMMTPRYLAAVEQLWGGAARMLTMPLEEPLLYSNQTDPATWPGNLYYEDFAKPQGIIDALVLYLVRDGSLIGAAGFSRHASDGPIKAAEIDALRLLAPHLRRAVTISGLLRSAESRIATFEAALDASSAGAVLVDDGMRILHANAAASRMLAAGDPVRDRGGLLELRAERSSNAIAGAVRAATQDAALGRRGIGIPARRLDGSPLVLTVMPLEQRRSRAGIAASAAAAVFIADAHETAIPAGAVHELFDLTPMEGRVFDLITAGLGTAGAAGELGVAPSTLRTHLLRVFSKTGRRSRAALVKLSMEMRPSG